MKKILHSVLWILAIAAIGFGVSFTNKLHREARCKSIEISIPSEADNIISTKNIEKIIFSTCDSIIGVKNKDINIKLIENTLKANPIIKDADVYINISSILKIKIITFSPLVRIINNNNKGRKDFYIDYNGNILPTNPFNPAHVIIASGHFKESFSDDLLTTNVNIYDFNKQKIFQDIFILAKYIDKQPFLSAQIDQIYINAQQEYELTPKIGKQIIIFGNIFDYKNKFQKLEAFYKQAIRKNGWKYKQINLKYKNQIVCSKI